jgi:hypothetical protein
MNPVAICCWAAFIVCLIAIGMMMYGEAKESLFHKYVAIVISCISALLLFIACLFA